MRFVKQFLSGCVYLGLVAWFLAGTSGRPLTWGSWAVTFLLVTVCAVAVTGLALTWLTSWALRRDSRWGQFGLASLLWAMLFVALFLASVRGLTLHWQVALVPRHPEAYPQVFLMVSVACLIVLIGAVPYLLMLTDSLLWMTVWLLRQPWVRRCLAWRPGGLRRSLREPKSDGQPRDAQLPPNGGMSP